MSAYNIEMLDLVAAVRQILTIAKSAQERLPDSSVADIIEAIDGAVTMKLAKLQMKGGSRSALQTETMYALKNAKIVMPDVLRILEGARERTPEEIADGLLAKETKAAKAKISREKSAATRSAKKSAEAAKAASQRDMFADEEEDEDA